MQNSRLRSWNLNHGVRGNIRSTQWPLHSPHNPTHNRPALAWRTEPTIRNMEHRGTPIPISFIHENIVDSHADDYLSLRTPLSPIPADSFVPGMANLSHPVAGFHLRQPL